jgi:cobalt/nickel transport system permease protein
MNLSHAVAWNELIAGLRTYHLPSLFIFVFDITIKYIVLLGGVALNVLEALRLRSVGKNTTKGDSSAGVLGVTFLKAQDFGAEMYEAMECRGFVGEYEVPREKIMNVAALLYLCCILCEVVIFLYLGGIV